MSLGLFIISHDESYHSKGFSSKRVSRLSAAYTFGHTVANCNTVNKENKALLVES